MIDDAASFAGLGRTLLPSLALILCTVGGCASTVDQNQDVRAPKLLSLEPMVGALHVSWQNEEPACDTNEVERTTVSADGTLPPFTLLYKLPGVADNKHDQTATQPVTYVYRVRCLKAGRYSSYSNELSADPTR